MMTQRKNPDIAPAIFYNIDLCPTRAVFSKLSGKWPVLIITHLSFGSHRFSELLGAIPDISQRMLTQTLRSLERDGIAIRTATASIPPRVDYRLSELGQSYLEGLESILQWSLRSRAEIEAAQAAYDDRAAANVAKAS